MSVSTVTNFVAAVNAVAPASKNVYNVTSVSAVYPNGTYSVVITKNGLSFLTVVYEAAQSQFVAENDANTGGWSVRWVGLDGVQHVSDAQGFINWLAAN
jgi:hypothetical protein